MRLETERAVAESYFSAREAQRLGGQRTSRCLLSRTHGTAGVWSARHGFDRSVGVHVDEVHGSYGGLVTNAEDALEGLFEQWRVQLDAGMAVALYGLGSKSAVLSRFSASALADCHVVSVRGYDPNSDALAALSFASEKVSSAGAPVAVVLEDASGLLGSPEAWRALTAVHAGGALVVMSFEGVRGCAGWLAPGGDPLAVWSSLRIAWHDCTTLRPYTLELSPLVQSLHAGVTLGSGDDDAMAGDDEALRIAGAEAVLASLPPAGRSVFAVLAECRLAVIGATNATEHADTDSEHDARSESEDENDDAMSRPLLSYAAWFRTCQERFVVSSELAFRTQLTELVDHRVVCVCGRPAVHGSGALAGEESRGEASFGAGDSFSLPFSQSAVERLLSSARS